MISISTDLQEEIQSDSQTVLPNVKAYMSDRRYIEDLSIVTSSHSYSKQIIDRKPKVYLKMDKTDYNIFQETLTTTINNASTAVVTSINHGLAAGTPVLISSDSTIPANLVYGEFFCAENFFYVQNPTTNQFNLNTIQANAISNSATGRVSTNGAGTTPTVTISIDNPAVFTSAGHGFNNGDAITIRTLGTLPTAVADGINVVLGSSTSIEYIYYVQNATTNTFNLNTTKIGAIENTDSGRIATSGSQSGIHNIYPIAYITYSYNGSHRLIDHGSIGLDVSIGSFDTIDRKNVYNNPLSPNTIQSLPIENKEIIEPKRLIDTFERANSDTLGFFTSSDTSDSSMGMYSWNTGNDKWSIIGVLTKKASLGGSGTTPAFIKYNTTCLDHFIDIKFNTLINGQGAVLRYTDEDNFVCIYYTGTAFRLVQVCGGYATTISTGNAYTFNTNIYYRFEAKYNTFSVYEMGTTEPSVGATGTAIALNGAATSVYVDDPVFRTSESTWIGAGNYLGADSGCVLDYVAIESFNYLSSYVNFATTRYAYATVNHISGVHTLNKNNLSNFQKLANYKNFTYSFIINPAVVTATRGFCWLGDKTSSTVYIELLSSARIKATIFDGTTQYSVTSSATTPLVVNTDAHVAVVLNGTKLSIFLNGVESASITTVPSTFTPYVSTSSDSCLRIGSGVSTTAYINAKIGEFAIFDYALTSDDINAMYKSIANNSTLPIETSDIYFNAEGVVGLFTEETFTWALTNGLNEKGNELKVNNSVYTLGSNYTLDPEYSKFNLATETNNIQSIMRDNYPWMSRVQSNSSKVFSNTDFLELNFSSLKCNKIFISTGYNTAAISTFDIVITKSDLTTITKTNQIFDYGSYTYVILDDVYDIISIKITPKTTVSANSFARIYCIDPIWEVDLSEYVISFDIDKVRENFDASLPIGATAANSGSLTLDNTDLLFSPYGNSTYSNYIYPDTRFFISFDHVISKTQNTENIQLGYELYADSWSVDNSSMQCNVSFRDYSKFLQEQNIRGYISQGFSAGRSIADIILTSGFPKRKIVYIDKYSEVVSQDDPKVFVPFNENFADLKPKTTRIVNDGTINSGTNVFTSATAKFSLKDYGASITAATGIPSSTIITGINDSTSVTMSNNATATTSTLVTTIGNFDFYNTDFCGLVKGKETAPNYVPYIKTGAPIVYSDLLTVQDDEQRLMDDYAYSIFVPENKVGSYSSADRIYFYNLADDTQWKPTSYNNANSWTFSLVHYIADTSYIGLPSSAIDLFHTGYDCRLQFETIDSSNVRYKLLIQDYTTFASYYITSPNVNIKKSHLIHVIKTAGSPNKYELFIDGISAGSITPSLSGSPAAEQAAIETVSNSSYISNFLYYNYPLTTDQINKHKNAFSVSIIPTYKYLSASESTYWDAMLNIATADLGMFYIDEYGYFRYEYRNILHGTTEDRFQTTQYNLSDEINIINGNISTEIQTNKVTVDVYKINTNSNSISSIWTAPDGESLAVTRLTEDLSLNSSYIALENLDNPIWLPSGYVKIDDEIIKYKAIFNNKTLVNIERGAFGTTPSVHASGARAREARFYDAVYTSSPATIANYPFISAQTGIYGASYIDIDFYYNTSFQSQILISAKDPGPPIHIEDNIPYYFKRGDGYSNIAILQGTDKYTDLPYNFTISGLTISLSETQDTVNKISNKIESNIRKFGVKELTLQNQFISNRKYAEIVAEYILDYYSNPIKILNLEVTGIPQLQLGDLVNIVKFDQLGIINTKFWVIQSKISYDGGIKHSLVLHQYSETVDPPEIAFEQNLADKEYFWYTVAGNPV